MFVVVLAIFVKEHYLISYIELKLHVNFLL